MVNFGPLAAEIDPVVWGTPANFNGFRVLAALLHGILLVGISQLCGIEQRAPPIFGMWQPPRWALAHISSCIYHAEGWSGCWPGWLVRYEDSILTNSHSSCYEPSFLWSFHLGIVKAYMLWCWSVNLHTYLQIQRLNCFVMKNWLLSRRICHVTDGYLHTVSCSCVWTCADEWLRRRRVPV